jgi:hypothetical protein
MVGEGCWECTVTFGVAVARGLVVGCVVVSAVPVRRGEFGLKGGDGLRARAMAPTVPIASTRPWALGPSPIVEAGLVAPGPVSVSPSY